MNYVWAVFHTDYDGDDKELIAIFPTKETAEEGLSQHIEKAIEIRKIDDEFTNRRHKIWDKYSKPRPKECDIEINQLDSEWKRWLQEINYADMYWKLPDIHRTNYSIKEVEMGRIYKKYSL